MRSLIGSSSMWPNPFQTFDLGIHTTSTLNVVTHLIWKEWVTHKVM